MQRPRRPLMTTPDELGPCQRYCEELKELVWESDRKLAALRAQVGSLKMRWKLLGVDAADADRQGHAIDVASFMRQLEQDWPANDTQES